jgi:hypothetical protein
MRYVPSVSGGAADPTLVSKPYSRLAVGVTTIVVAGVGETTPPVLAGILSAGAFTPLDCCPAMLEPA